MEFSIARPFLFYFIHHFVFHITYLLLKSQSHLARNKKKKKTSQLKMSKPKFFTDFSIPLNLSISLRLLHRIFRILVTARSIPAGYRCVPRQLFRRVGAILILVIIITWSWATSFACNSLSIFFQFLSYHGYNK